MARVKVASTMHVPKEVAAAHPHLLLMLESQTYQTHPLEQKKRQETWLDQCQTVYPLIPIYWSLLMVEQPRDLVAGV